MTLMGGLKKTTSGEEPIAVSGYGDNGEAKVLGTAPIGRSHPVSGAVAAELVKAGVGAVIGIVILANSTITLIDDGATHINAVAFVGPVYVPLGFETSTNLKITTNAGSELIVVYV